MPLKIPRLDDRSYQQLVDETLARVPVHTPEWTNFNQSDPGVTLVQLYAFITETLLYRCNQVPERNRRKFLEMLGRPLRPASSAQGLVVFSNERGPFQTLTLDRGVEVRAGEIPFHTTRGLDVLPIEWKVYYKRQLPVPPAEQLEYYKQLYASYLPGTSVEPQLYETVPVTGQELDGIDLAASSVDKALWIALLVRTNDASTETAIEEARKQLGGMTLNLGIVPYLDATNAEKHLLPGTGAGAGSPRLIEVALPILGEDRTLPADRVPQYRVLETLTLADDPQVYEIPLPAATDIGFWEDLDPLEQGADAMPPALEDTPLNERLITWLRVKWPEGAQAQVQWAGINVTSVSQRASVRNELLPPGNGEPDQSVTLSKAPVIPGSVKLIVTVADSSASEQWTEIDDLLSAGPEVPTTDFRLHPGLKPAPPRNPKVFTVDAEAGRIRFGDGMRGARPSQGTNLRADYEYGVGAAGNVGAGAIKTSPALPAGVKVTNPVRTWGGADAESIVEAEKQITRFLQHRERLVNTADFEAITLRAPGVQIARVEVLPAYNPNLARNEPGNAPGAVTLMLIPRFSAIRPDAPSPDAVFIKAVCEYLEPRRLVTTELFLRGPDYNPVWVSVGINVVAGRSFDSALVREAVKKRIQEFLSPISAGHEGELKSLTTLLTTPQADQEHNGWPMRRAVSRNELIAEVIRVPGVAFVNDLFLGGATGDAAESIPMSGLQLPRLDGISVTTGDPLALAQLRGDLTATEGTTPTTPQLVPLPAIPQEC